MFSPAPSHTPPPPSPPWSKLAQYGDPLPVKCFFFVPEVSITRLQEERNQQLQPVAMHLTEQTFWSGRLELDQQLTGSFPGVYSRHLKSPSVNFRLSDDLSQLLISFILGGQNLFFPPFIKYFIYQT